VEVTTSGSKDLEGGDRPPINEGGNFDRKRSTKWTIPLSSTADPLSVQSANIQGVSGPSYTVAGFRQSLHSALSSWDLLSVLSSTDPTRQLLHR